MAEIALFVVALGVPILLGAVVAYLGRPWWWAALGAIVLAFVAAIAPTPEAGESRLAAGDLVFLLVLALFVAGLTWLGSLLGRRMRRR